jgi:hypothetical protein
MLRNANEIVKNAWVKFGNKILNAN